MIIKLPTTPPAPPTDQLPPPPPMPERQEAPATPPKDAAPAPAQPLWQPPPGAPAPGAEPAVPKEKLLFTDTPHCKMRVHCVACLAPDKLFRQSMGQSFKFPDDNIDFVCPGGINPEEAKRLQNLRQASEAPLPSMIERASNLAKASGRRFKAMVGNQEIDVERAVYLSRLAQCFSCPSKQFRPSDQTCADCGCPVRNKAAWATEMCKLGYWQIRVSREPFDELVLTPNILMEDKDKLLAAVPSESKVANAIKVYDAEVSKPDGCSGCRKRQLQAEVAAAFIEELPGYGEETKVKIKALFPRFERISDNKGVHPLAGPLSSWASSSGPQAPAPQAPPSDIVVRSQPPTPPK